MVRARDREWIFHCFDKHLCLALMTECCEQSASLMVDRTGLDNTMLHYLAVWRAMVSLHRAVHSKITLIYSLT